MKSPTSEVTFRIVLVKPTAGVDFGLQQGKGADYETVQKQRSTGADLTFALSARFKPGIDGEPPDFLGPFVQGPKGGRFIYIDIGACAGQANTPWDRRLKIPLGGISQALVNRVLAATGACLQTQVPGTGKDGGPNCATVKPFAGWKLNTG